MKKFKWTRSVPNVKGYYWVREFKTDEEPHVSIQEIRKYGNNLAIHNCPISAYEDKDIDWAGPIPYPQD